MTTISSIFKWCQILNRTESKSMRFGLLSKWRKFHLIDWWACTICRFEWCVLVLRCWNSPLHFHSIVVENVNCGTSTSACIWCGPTRARHYGFAFSPNKSNKRTLNGIMFIVKMNWLIQNGIALEIDIDRASFGLCCTINVLTDWHCDYENNNIHTMAHGGCTMEFCI